MPVNLDRAYNESSTRHDDSDFEAFAHAHQRPTGGTVASDERVRWGFGARVNLGGKMSGSKTNRSKWRRAAREVVEMFWRAYDTAKRGRR